MENIKQLMVRFADQAESFTVCIRTQERNYDSDMRN